MLYESYVRDCMDRGFTAIKTTLPGFYSKWTSVHHEIPAQIPARLTETELLPRGIFEAIAECALESLMGVLGRCRVSLDRGPGAFPEGMPGERECMSPFQQRVSSMGM